MRRSEILILTGLTTAVFNTWRRRKCLPFDDPKGSGWGQYSIQNVIALDLAASLVQAGVPQVEAGRSVKQLERELFRRLLVNGRTTVFGSVVYQDVAFEADDRASLRRIPFCCDIADLGDQNGLHPKDMTWPTRRGFVFTPMGDRLDAIRLRAELTSQAASIEKELDQVWG